MINRYPSQYISNAVLVDVLSKITNTPPNVHILKKRKDLIKEVGRLPESEIIKHLTEKEISYLKRPKKERKLPVFLSDEEMNKMFEVLRLQNDIRTEILMKFLYNTGCRPSEAARVRIKDIDFNNKFVLLKETKGKQQRTALFFNEDFLQSLRLYIGNKKNEDYLFLSNWNKPYTVKGITKKIKSIAKQAGLDVNRVSAHKFRHTHAVNAIKKGVSIISVRDQLGHSNISITNEYTKIIDSVRRKDYEEHQPFSSKIKTDSKYCSNCGMKLNSDANFCSGCGGKQ
ncbi:tyrosine-type recombinase/integrase [Candidatus Woesearchaeota archaeon]|nr:tyrosine-type recombinase/integrase [Candidatus Woesearchaeota archaeon]